MSIFIVVLGCSTTPDPTGKQQHNRDTDTSQVVLSPDDTSPPSTDTAPTTPTTTADTGEPLTTSPTVLEVSVTLDPDLVHHVVWSVTTNATGPARVTCITPKDPAEHHVLEVEGEGDMGGLLAGVTYACTVEADGAVQEVALTTDPLPASVPTLVVEGTPSRPSYTLVNHWWTGDGPQVQKVIIYDPEGRSRFYHAWRGRPSGGVEATWLTESSEIFAVGGHALSPTVLSLERALIWEGPMPSSEQDWHHDGIVRDDGSILALASAPNLFADKPLVGFVVDEVDRTTGEIVWTYNSQQAIDAELLLAHHSLEPYHANAIAWVPDDPSGPSIWVSLSGIDKIGRIDIATQEMTWLLGAGRGFQLLDTEGEPISDISGGWFTAQHDIQVDYPKLLLHDNGLRNPTGHRSRAMEYEIDTDARTLKQLREWSEPGWFEPHFGAVDWLPGGTWFIVTGHLDRAIGPEDGRSSILEVNPDTGEVLHRMTATEPWDAFYRGHRIDGCGLWSNTRYCPLE